jgi:hypothetical protein
MIVIFHENVLLLSTYKFIVIPIKYLNFGTLVYDSAEKQMLSAISLVIEQRKNEFDILYPELSFLLRYTPSLSTPILQEFCKI